jgi:hypothetical protein
MGMRTTFIRILDGAAGVSGATAVGTLDRDSITSFLDDLFENIERG